MKNEIKHDIIRFMFGGNCIFTVVDDSSDTHLTFKIRRKKTDDGSKIYHACIIHANKNIYFGYFKIIGNKLIFKHSTKYDVSPDDYRVKKLLSIIRGRRSLSENIHICHNDRCAHCGRILTDPDSMERGFGPDCWRKVRNYI